MRKVFLALAFCSSCLKLGAEVYLGSADDVLKIARTNDIEGALNLKAAQEGVRLARMSLSPFLPQFDFSISDSASAEKQRGSYKQKALEVGVTQKIFNGGKSFLEYKMQREKAGYDFLDAQKIQEEKERAVLKAYYDALLLKLKSEILAEAAGNADTVFGIAQVESLEGLISSADFLESQIRRQKLRAEAKSAASAFAQASRDLSVLMNLDLSEKIVFVDCLNDYDKGSMETLAKGAGERTKELTALAIQKSLDLKKARAKTAWAKKQRALLKRSFMPSLSVRAGASFNGGGYPLTEPAYSIKFIVGFDDNPWLPTSLSKNSTLKDGALISMADSISGKGIINTSFLGQMKLGKINIENCRLDAEKVQKEIECKVFNLIQKIESLEESAEINEQTLALKEQKLSLLKIQLDEGSATKSDYLENLNELANEKINFLKTKIERDLLVKELEALASCKLQ